MVFVNLDGRYSCSIGTRTLRNKIEADAFARGFAPTSESIIECIVYQGLAYCRADFRKTQARCLLKFFASMRSYDLMPASLAPLYRADRKLFLVGHPPQRLTCHSIDIGSGYSSPLTDQSKHCVNRRCRNRDKHAKFADNGYQRVNFHWPPSFEIL